MASPPSLSQKLTFIFICWLELLSSEDVGCAGGVAAAPAMYVFGDSLADVGNNNHLDFTFLRANFPHNGVDFPGGMPTGRYSNGKNMADFLAEKIGVNASTPFLSISSRFNQTNAIFSGLSFASGGAGVIDSTNSGQCLSFNQQIDYYSAVYEVLVQQLGSQQVQASISQSIFSIIIGSNDIMNYAKSSQSKSLNSLHHLVDSLIPLLRSQLKRLYELGARKYAFFGTGAIGCCPALRQLNQTKGCNAEANYLSYLYNDGAVSILREMNSELQDMKFSFFNTSLVLFEYINNPDAYGFVEVEAACCGLGDLNAKIACLPFSSLCSKRGGHLFWDLYHPSEAAVDLITTTAVDGSFPFVYPVNIRQLISI